MFNFDFVGELYNFRLCKEGYDEFLDIYPAWVVEAANLLVSCKGYDSYSLVACPQFLAPVHDALHVYTGIETTMMGEVCIGALEDHLMGRELEAPEELEEAKRCWSRVNATEKKFFENFYKGVKPYFLPTTGEDFYEYYQEWVGFLQEADPELFKMVV